MCDTEQRYTSMADICCIAALGRQSRIILEYNKSTKKQLKGQKHNWANNKMIVNEAKTKLMICGKKCIGDICLKDRRQNL